MVPAGQRRQGGVYVRRGAHVERHPQHGLSSQAPAGLYYPGDPGFPGNSGMNIVWSNLAPRVGVSWDPNGDGRTSVRADTV